MGSSAAEQTTAERRQAFQITQHAGLGSERTLWSLIHPGSFLGHGCHCHPPPPHLPLPAQESLSHLWGYEFKPRVGSWSLCLAASGHLLPTASSRTGSYLGVWLFPTSLSNSPPQYSLGNAICGLPWVGGGRASTFYLCLVPC